MWRPVLTGVSFFSRVLAQDSTSMFHIDSQFITVSGQRFVTTVDHYCMGYSDRVCNVKVGMWCQVDCKISDIYTLYAHWVNDITLTIITLIVSCCRSVLTPKFSTYSVVTLPLRSSIFARIRNRKRIFMG